MKINLQKFTLSTLTFSLATTLAVGGFSESASARNSSGSIGSSANIPALKFDVFLEDENDKLIEDAKPDDNLGVFNNAIEIIDSGNFTRVREGDLERGSGAVVKKGGQFDLGFDNDNNPTVASLSAELNGNEITYQIFLGDYKSPTDFLKLAPIDVSSRPDDINGLVNNLGFILDDGKEGTYDVEGPDDPNNLVDPKVGVLGRAIDLSIRFQGEDEPDGFDDFLQIKKFDSPPSTSTSIPEPTTTLASVFALAFAGKFLRKSKKSNA